jgi:hypothetical protein
LGHASRNHRLIYAQLHWLEKFTLEWIGGPPMTNKRGFLFSMQKLLGEGIEQILVGVDGLEICGHWPIDGDVMDHFREAVPDFVVFAGQVDFQPDISHLTSLILEKFPDLPVFVVGLERNQIQVFSSHLLPARSADLIELIQRSTARENL